MRGTGSPGGSGPADRDAVGTDISVEVPSRSRPIDFVASGCSRRNQGTLPRICQRWLWPLCHITLDRITSLKRFGRPTGCESPFCRSGAEELDREPGPVWIHDFQLALLPSLVKVRSRLCRCPCFGTPMARSGCVAHPSRTSRSAAWVAGIRLSCSKHPATPTRFSNVAHEFRGAVVTASGDQVLYNVHETR